MNIHPMKLPLFVYGTLRSDRKYFNDTMQFEHTICKAYACGKLFYVDYTDENGALDVTVAFDPDGAQKVLGELLFFNDSATNNALALLDEKEFNFHDLSGKCKKRERVYIRTVITCTDEYCNTRLAWSYIYVSSDFKPSLLVNPDCNFGAETEFIPISYSEYIRMINSKS